MSRAFYGWVIVGLIAFSSGCRMGAHPFDYSGPAATAEEVALQGDTPPRSGSILSYPVGPALGGDYPTDGVVLPVEDQLLGELMEPAADEAQPVPTPVELEESEAVGWTARSPRHAARR